CLPCPRWTGQSSASSPPPSVRPGRWSRDQGGAGAWSSGTAPAEASRRPTCAPPAPPGSPSGCRSCGWSSPGGCAAVASPSRPRASTWPGSPWSGRSPASTS
ncbi:MAG: Hydrolase SCO5215, alpha/beta fold family, partial [uncultured Frankineae bacterium]